MFKTILRLLGPFVRRSTAARCANEDEKSYHLKRPGDLLIFYRLGSRVNARRLSRSGCERKIEANAPRSGHCGAIVIGTVCPTIAANAPRANLFLP
jgi:hypothetical protein